MIILETKRLLAKVPTKQSLENRYQLLSNSKVALYIGDGKAKTKIEVKEFLQKNITHYQEFGFCLFDIFEKDSGEFIGDAGLMHEGLNPENKNIEVGYRLMEKFWNYGYATELAEAFIKWGFEKFSLEEIFAFCKKENIASSNVMKKCDMKYNGEYLYKGEVPCESYFIHFC